MRLFKINNTSQRKQKKKGLLTMSNKYYNFPQATEIFNCYTPLRGAEEGDMSDIIIRILRNNKIQCNERGVTEGILNCVYKFELLDYTITKQKLKKLESIIELYSNGKQISIVFDDPNLNGFSVVISRNTRPIIPLGSLLNTDEFYNMHKEAIEKGSIPIALGINNADKPVYADLSSLPHLLIAGTTGSGKSTCVHNIITTILYTAVPGLVKFVLIDPKKIELNMYSSVTNSLLYPIIDNVYNVYNALYMVNRIMDKRYETLKQLRLRNFTEYKALSLQQNLEPWERIVIVIDELADVFGQVKAEVEPDLIRLAQQGRAAGIHLILATQYPSCKVVTSELKINIPGKVCFALPNRRNSQTILDSSGAEKLLGKGDGLFTNGTSSELIRFQGGLVTDQEIQNLIDYINDDSHYVTN